MVPLEVPPDEPLVLVPPVVPEVPVWLPWEAPPELPLLAPPVLVPVAPPVPLVPLPVVPVLPAPVELLGRVVGEAAPEVDEPMDPLLVRALSAGVVALVPELVVPLEAPGPPFWRSFLSQPTKVRAPTARAPVTRER